MLKSAALTRVAGQIIDAGQTRNLRQIPAAREDVNTECSFALHVPCGGGTVLTEGETQELRRYHEAQLIPDSPVLIVKRPLRCDDIGGISASRDDVRHDHDEGVLFDVPWTGVE